MLMIKLFDTEKARLNGLSGVFVLAVLIASCVGLSFVLLHNPYKNLQQQIFKTADRVRNYYRDRPGYWKLSTESAKQDDLLRSDLLQYKEYDFQIGQGIDGTFSLPSNLTFDLSVKHLNKSACVSLSEMPLDSNAKLSLVKISIINQQNEVEFTWGGEHSLPIEKYSARNFCQPQENIIIWTFQ